MGMWIGAPSPSPVLPENLLLSLPKLSSKFLLEKKARVEREREEEEGEKGEGKEGDRGGGGER